MSSVVLKPLIELALHKKVVVYEISIYNFHTCNEMWKKFVFLNTVKMQKNSYFLLELTFLFSSSAPQKAS
jgi:hypothetical protein